MTKNYIIFILSLVLVGCGDDDLTPSEQLAKDVKTIDAYLLDNNITALSHDSGLRYTIEAQGDEVSPAYNSDISFTYTAILLDGLEKVDESTTPITFNLQQLVPAWQIALPLIGRGGRMTLYAPSGLCYGTRGSPPIPPNANMIFNLELHDID